MNASVNKCEAQITESLQFVNNDEIEIMTQDGHQKNNLIQPTAIRVSILPSELNDNSLCGCSVNNSSPSNDAPDESGIQVGSELIIDGLVIEPNNIKTERRKNVECVCLITISASTAILFFVVFFFLFNNRKFALENISTPSMFPSSAPSTNFDYYQHIDDILMPITDEKKRKDPSTIQYKVFRHMVKDLPRLVSESILQLNETYRITQRYAALVAGALSSRYASSIASAYDNINIQYPDACVIFMCNAQKEIIIIELSNEWYTRRGGGIIASEIGLITSLSHIILTGSGIYGTIPTEIGNLDRLEMLYLSRNKLNGTLPETMSELMSLKELFIDSNLFSGQISPSFPKLKNLEYINLSDNKFTGSLPHQIGSLEYLKGIDISKNEIYCNLNFLCGKNFSDGIYENKVIINDFRVHEYSMNEGVTVSCEKLRDFEQCQCCRCV